jgi:hypothetical protein
MMSAKTRKLLMTIRAALIMAAKAIEEYCRDETNTTSENVVR